eukprot:scaffold118370_cov22-Tisochrysis_lutea.AAC.2
MLYSAGKCDVWRCTPIPVCCLGGCSLKQAACAQLEPRTCLISLPPSLWSTACGSWHPLAGCLRWVCHELLQVYQLGEGRGEGLDATKALRWSLACGSWRPPTSCLRLAGCWMR